MLLVVYTWYYLYFFPYQPSKAVGGGRDSACKKKSLAILAMVLVVPVLT